MTYNDESLIYWVYAHNMQFATKIYDRGMKKFKNHYLETLQNKQEELVNVHVLVIVLIAP